MKTQLTILFFAAGLSIQSQAVEIGFEAAQGYTEGQSPSAPWTTPEPARSLVTQTVARSGSQSLSILKGDSYYGFYGRAIYPIHVAEGQSASFSLWIRPAVLANPPIQRSRDVDECG